MGLSDLSLELLRKPINDKRPGRCASLDLVSNQSKISNIYLQHKRVFLGLRVNCIHKNVIKNQIPIHHSRTF